MEKCPNNDESIESPIIEINSSAGKLVMHWFNTQIRLHKDPQYNHVEYIDDEGQLKGVHVPNEVLDVLFENDFPYIFEPLPTDATTEWYIKSQAMRLEAELDEL